MAEFTHYIYICVYTHHIWRPQGGSSHGAGPWATDLEVVLIISPGQGMLLQVLKNVTLPLVFFWGGGL